MKEFKEQYQRLNEAQRQAVDAIDGPLLVIAGPGTGKTQLLATRAANILQKTDVHAGNILCLTFTENAASEMRTRLREIIGGDAARIAVHTFHSFGTEIIANYPEYFDYYRRDLTPLDDIGRFELIEKLLAKLPYRHVLAGQDEEGHFTSLRAVENGIKAIKQSGLSIDDLQYILKHNQKQFEKIEQQLNELFSDRLSFKKLNGFEAVISTLADQDEPLKDFVYPLGWVLGTQLSTALHEARAAGNTGPIGRWRNAHMTRSNGQLILKSHAKMVDTTSLIELYVSYQAELKKLGRFDYEDMVLWVVNAMSESDDLRLSLAEQYLYIMVDEYQDTNGAQNRLLDELSGIGHGFDQPNVMVVGDDDQAIMRFQGADISNMLDFVKNYRPAVVTLTDNYRSHQQILEAARAIITQTEDRLEVNLGSINLNKQLTAKNTPEDPVVIHPFFHTKPHEFHWVGSQIKKLVANGVPAQEIAVLAPRHAILIEFSAYLQHHNLPVAYERRDNILDQECIIQLLKLAEVVLAIREHRHHDADSLLAEVLAYDFWDLKTIDLYKLAIVAGRQKNHWLEIMLDGQNKSLADIAEWLIAVSASVKRLPFEQLLDLLIGNRDLPKTKLERSPFKEYYFGEVKRKEQIVEYVQLLFHLSTLRDTTREHFGRERYYLSDFLELIGLYQRSKTKIIDSSPLTSNPNAVQLMTAHAAKGREFDTVFMLNMVDGVWGPTARSGGSNIYLPENLPLYPAGSNDSDRLRLLYVSMTRAKRQLYLTSSELAENGRPATSLRYINLGESENGWWQPQSANAPTQSDLNEISEASWRQRYRLPPTKLKELLAAQLSEYALSPTHLKNFLDLRYSGPEYFLLTNLLRFPQAKHFSSSFGSCVHSAIEKLQANLKTSGQLPSIDDFISYFIASLKREQLADDEEAKAIAHAKQILPVFYKHAKTSFKSTDIVERQFATKALGNLPIRLRGKIDKLTEIGKGNLIVTDYKTGKSPEPNWTTSGVNESKRVSLHFNQQQLLFYKLLLENTPAYHTKRIVSQAELYFVEPHPGTGENVRLTLETFDNKEMENLVKLIQAVWQRIIKLDFPDITKYSADLKGILAFEQDLIKEVN